MKLKILSTDQIVGLVIILALASLAFVIVMLGQAQRWFSKDMDFNTVLPSATGLSKNMAVQYRGFTIGNVKDFYLNDDNNVEVIFTINEEYTDRVRQGSIVELQAGIVSLLGNSFLFHPGREDQQLLAEGTFIPIKGSAQANEYIRQRIATVSESEDSISNLMNQINSLLGGVNLLIADLNADLGPDEAHTTDIGKLIGGISTTVNDIPQILDSTIDGVLNPVLAELRPLLSHIDDLLVTLNEPGGIITMLDSDGALNETIDSLPGLIGSLNDAIAPLPGLIENLNNSTASLPSQLPVVLTQLRTVLRSVDDVLVGLANNPLLRGGVPERPVTQTTGPRDIRF
ncbi:MAG: MlaD family protein [Treponema sp.]|jgi:phospholipid/cholesterol/gamma-HCH transport system substrate-binding protein|nr:MlaD family protein [Treponema sp.]